MVHRQASVTWSSPVTSSLFGVTPEFAANVDNRSNLGELNPGAGEVQDVIAFLKALSDR
jgi:hypothetical protein